MIHFAWPWVLLLLPLPLLLRRYLAPVRRPGPTLRVPFLARLQQLPQTTSLQPSNRWPLLLASCGWLLLLLATARPQWLGEPVPLATSGRDLLLAVDLSGSMAQQDFLLNEQAVDRLTATKAVAGEFLSRRTGDRVGLLLFGDRPYLQAPLTFDRKTVRQLLDEAQIGMAGKATAIGDAIGLATKLLRRQPANDRVLILITDGANTAGEIPPRKAAELAAQHRLKVYTIGVGATQLEVRTLFGRQLINPSNDLDEETLTAVAETTGGRYFRASRSSEMEEIYRQIDRLEPVDQGERPFRPRVALYPWPLALALLLALATLLMSRRVDRV